MAAPRRAEILVDDEGHITSMDALAQGLWGKDHAGSTLRSLFERCGGWLPPSDDAWARGAHGRFPVGFTMDVARGGWRIQCWDRSEAVAGLERLRTSERQLREAQEVAHVGNWEWDVENDVIVWSDELYRIYGLEPQSFPATFQAYIERIHPDDRALAQGVVEKAFQDMGPFSFDHRVVRDDGEVRWLHGQGAVEAREGKPVRMYGVGQDITALKEAEETARRARENEMQVEHLKELDAARSQMLNALAHEMNTPLTPMRLQTHLLGRGMLGDLDERQEKAVRVLDQNLSRLAVLLADMLDLARLETGRLEIHPKPTSIAPLVENTVDAYEAEAQERGICLRVDIQPVEATLDGDRMTQVLYNLTSNAIKFSDRGGEVRLRTGQEDGDAWIEVEDDGIGLDEAQRERLFEPFSRVHDDDERPGTGLGLHISRSIVEQHGGTLTCHSEGPGKGALFRVRIPRADPPAPQAATHAA